VLPRLIGASDATVRDTTLALREAQFVVAREYGFDSWAKLKAHVESDTDVKHDVDRTGGLVAAHQAYAALLSNTLSDALDEEVEVLAGSSASLQYETYVRSLGETCCVYNFEIKPDNWPFSSSAPVAVNLSMPMAEAILGKSSLTSDLLYELRNENVLLEDLVPVVRKIIASFERIWEVSPAMQVGDANIVIEPSKLRIAEADDECSVVPFAVKSQTLTTVMHLCYPRRTMDAVLFPYLNGSRPDHFEPVSSSSGESLTKMFSSHSRCRLEIGRALLDNVGTVLVDDAENPSVAHIVLPGGDSVFGGM
jgi:hypothetical protein